MFELGFMLFGAALAVTGVMAANLPQTFRSRRWAIRYGNEDERRAGQGMFWTRLGVIAAAIAFDLWTARTMMTYNSPDIDLAAGVSGLFFCVALLYAQAQYSGISRPGRKSSNH